PLVLSGLGLLAPPAIVTFLIRNRTSDAAFPFFFTVGTASLVSASSSDLRSADFSPTGLGHRLCSPQNCSPARRAVVDDRGFCARLAHYRAHRIRQDAMRQQHDYVPTFPKREKFGRSLSRPK